MATNPPKGDNHRQGAVRDRSQVHNPKNDRWVKRDGDSGRFLDQKIPSRSRACVRRNEAARSGCANVLMIGRN
jgi:hypothetical protein